MTGPILVLALLVAWALLSAASSAPAMTLALQREGPLCIARGRCALLRMRGGSSFAALTDEAGEEAEVRIAHCSCFAS
jgi:hypothetical protein